MFVIETNNLRKYYGKHRGIENLNLCVEKGTFFGFIGPNGAGKSTTIRTLLGYLHATDGDAKVLGIPIKNTKSILARVGYMPSEAIFYPNLKVAEILNLSSSLHKKDCSKDSNLLCERLQLDKNRKIKELSFGNRKKVSIVCALQHNPELLILDEPTSGLDPLIQHEFFEILKEKKQSGITVFLSSHVLSEVRKNCDSAAIIKDGQIIAQDTINKLIQSNIKHVVLHGNIAIDGLDGVKNMNQTAAGKSFLYEGDIQKLLHTINQPNLQDIQIQEPELEEIFLHYYQKGEK